MGQAQKLPDAHTDFILSVQWDGIVWASVLLGLVGVAAVIAVLRYRRRRRS
jgi:cell division protein FtsW (lipid II flippase)